MLNLILVVIVTIILYPILDGLQDYYYCKAIDEWNKLSHELGERK